jgi:hypothetical protein
MTVPFLITFPIPGDELEAVLRVAPLRSYLLSKGWVEKPWDHPYGLWFELPRGEGRKPIPLPVPAVETIVDYARRLEEVMYTLQKVEGRPARDILKDILAQPVAAPTAPTSAGAESPQPTPP